METTDVWEVTVRGSTLRAVQSQTMSAWRMKTSGRADGHTAARFRRDGERDKRQERGEQECHRTPAIQLSA